MEALTDDLLPVSHTSQHMVRKSATYADSLLFAFSELQRHNLFCDVTLTSDDGTFQTKVHKVVLVAASGYLRSLLLDPDLIVNDHITVPNVSGSCLEKLVTYMYTGSLCLTADTVNVMLVVASQLEMSSIVELCEEFIANPHYQDPWIQNGLAECNMEGTKQSCGDEIFHLRKASVKVEAANIIDNSAFNLPIPVSSTVTRTTRSFSRKHQAMRSKESSQETTPPVTSSHAKKTGIGRNLPGRRKRCVTAKRDQDLPPAKRSVSIVSMNTNEKNDPDWNPMANSSHSVNRYNIRKHSRSALDKSVSPNICVRAVRCKRIFSSSDRTPLLRISRKRSALAVRNQNIAFYSSPSWQQSRKMLLVARVFLAKQREICSSGSLNCRQCEARNAFRSSSHLAAHILCRHSRQLLCSLCNQKFVSFLALVRHRSSKHCHFRHRHLSMYSCNKVCIKSQSGPSVTLSKSASLHNKCGWCALKFETRSLLLEHRKAVHRKRTYAAMIHRGPRVVRDWNCREKDCSAKFKQKDNLCQHMAKHHPTVIFSCPGCRFKTQVEHILKRHLVKRHHEHHSCEMCGKGYHKPFLLRIHMYNRHRVKDPLLKLFRCSHEGCDYECPSKNGMKCHALKHAQGNTFSCDVCGKTFKRQGGLDKHTSKIHLGIRPYICDKCGASYGDEGELRTHLARHSESKPFSCNLCSYSTYQKGSLKSHLFSRHQVLMDDKMPILRCDYCSFLTDKRSRFDDHVKMHHNIRDIPCNECGKLFVTKKVLRQHIIKVHRRITATPTATTGALTAATSAAVRKYVIPVQVQKLNEEQQQLADATVTAAEASTTSQELFTAANASRFQSPTTVQSSVTALEYQMLMPLSTSRVSATADVVESLSQVAAVSGTGPIIVGISVPTVDNVATYQTFQPFDARLVL